MAVTPLITFKAGPCGIDVSTFAEAPPSGPLLTTSLQDTSKPFKVTPKQEQGYIYLYQDDDGMSSLSKLLGYCLTG